MDALKGLAWLLLCQSAGEAVGRLAGIGLPGPVIGLLIMLAALNARVVRDAVAAAADALLAHLSLLFVPVGVGVMVHIGLVAEYGVRLVAVLVVSTWAGLAATALVLRALWRDERAD